LTCEVAKCNGVTPVWFDFDKHNMDGCGAEMQAGESCQVSCRLPYVGSPVELTCPAVLTQHGGARIGAEPVCSSELVSREEEYCIAETQKTISAKANCTRHNSQIQCRDFDADYCSSFIIGVM
jgi:hypothetical protein